MAQAVQDKIRTLRDSEAKFHAIADYSHDLEIWINMQGKTLWVNPAVRWMAGYTPEDCFAMDGFPAKIVADEHVSQARMHMRLSVLKRTAGQDYLAHVQSLAQRIAPYGFTFKLE